MLFAADPFDETKLPPPAAVKIDFTRDIQPILETSCLRCHGPEKPKSRFRLDNREGALKGGEKGVDILPGNSAKSPFIHYVAFLVEEMEMPPLDKGKQLTPEQVGLLRAWIDQGVAWAAAAPTNNFAFSISPIFGGTTVSGDAHKFREHYWQREGLNGGVEQFELFEQTSPDTQVLIAGHALRDDYKMVLSAERNEIGFIHSGWEQYRKYFDDTGGYYPAFTPSALSLGRDLHLDIGKAWIDFGLTLPHWPQMVLGYEYDYKQGEESTTDWGGVAQGGNSRNSAPASKEIHESLHIIKFDLDHEVRGVTIEERFRGEFYNLQTGRTNTVFYPAVSTMTSENVNEGYHHFQGANTIRLEKKFNDWFFGSAGYLYSQLNADASFSLDTMNIFGPAIGDQHWRMPQIALQQESHVFNINGLLGPFDGLTISTGIQSEWTRQHGFGSGSLDLGFPGLPLFLNPATLSSDYDKASVDETLALRYTKIPFTVLFAELRLQQQSIGQAAQLSDFFNDNNDFLQNTAFSSRLSDLRVGFSTSPWQSVAFSAHYRRYEADSQYQNNRNEQPHGVPGFGYPGFIRARDLLTDEAEAKMVLHPCAWCKSSLSYRFVTTSYWTDTDPIPGDISPGGNLLSGQYDAHIISLNTTITSYRRLFLSTTFAYENSITTTANNGVPAIVPYRGNVYTVIANGTYVLSDTTDLFAGYSFSAANYGQDNFADGLPVGIQYQQHGVQIGLARRLGKNISAKLQYRFNYYDEPSSGGANNYRSHAIFGTMTFKLP